MYFIYVVVITIQNICKYRGIIVLASVYQFLSINEYLLIERMNNTICYHILLELLLE